MMQHPRVEFAFYSAIMRKNVEPIIRSVFKNMEEFYTENMFAIFDQSFCRPNKKITGDKYGFIRDLKSVWSSSNCKDFH